MSLSSIQQGGSSYRDTASNQSQTSSPRKLSKQTYPDIKKLNLKLIQAFDTFEEQVKVIASAHTQGKTTPVAAQLISSHRSININKPNVPTAGQNSFRIKMSRGPSERETPLKLTKSEMSNLARKLKELRSQPSLVSVLHSESEAYDEMHNIGRVSERLSTERLNHEGERPATQGSQVKSHRDLTIQESMERAFKYRPKTAARVLGPARTVATIKAKMETMKDPYQSPVKLKDVRRMKDSAEKMAKIKLLNSQRSTTAGSERTPVRTTVPTQDNSPCTTFQDFSRMMDRKSTDSGFLSPSEKKNLYKERLTSSVAKDIGAYSRPNSMVFKDDQVKEIIETLRGTGVYSPRIVKPKTAGYNKEFQGKRGLKRFGMYKPEVTEEEKRRLEVFLGNGFVNEVIEEKHHRKFEEKKMSCFEEIRKIIIDNRAVRFKYHHELEDYQADYKEQLKRKKRYQAYKEEELTVPKDYQKVNGFEIFTPDQSFYIDARLQPLMYPKGLKKQPRSPRKLTKLQYDEELDRKILQSFQRAMENAEKNDLSRIEGIQKAGAFVKGKFERIILALLKLLKKWGKLKLSIQEARYQ